MPHIDLVVFMAIPMAIASIMIFCRKWIDGFLVRVWDRNDAAQEIVQHQTIRPILPFSGQKIQRQ